jgi:plastocyanin
MNLKYKILMLFVLGLSFSYIGFSGQITGKVDTDPKKAKYKPNTVVYIEKADGNFKAPTKNPEMNQKNMVFIPRVLPILAGTTVDFLNNDDVLHNVFSPDACADKFNLGQWKKGEVRSHKYNKAGCQSVILCKTHPEMEAYVVVLQNPYYAVTDKDGNFTIKNVPAGKYTLMVWNEKLKADPQTITVTASGKVEVSFMLKK